MAGEVELAKWEASFETIRIPKTQSFEGFTRDCGSGKWLPPVLVSIHLRFHFHGGKGMPDGIEMVLGMPSVLEITTVLSPFFKVFGSRNRFAKSRV